MTVTKDAEEQVVPMHFPTFLYALQKFAVKCPKLDEVENGVVTPLYTNFQDERGPNTKKNKEDRFK